MWGIDSFENFTKALSTPSQETIHVSPYLYNYACVPLLGLELYLFFFFLAFIFGCARSSTLLGGLSLVVLRGGYSLVEVCRLPVVAASRVDHRL